MYRKVRAVIAMSTIVLFCVFKFGNIDALTDKINTFVASADSLINGTKSISSNSGLGTISKASERKKDNGTIVRVIDGDTMEVEINNIIKTVRLIGIDTPESVSNNKKIVNTEYGKIVSIYVKKLLPKGTKITLRYDKDRTDKYDRTLAYVYVKGNKKTYMLNKQLVRKGYARAVYYKPNGKHKEIFEKLHNRAKKKRLGFWGIGKTTNDGYSLAFPGK